MKKLLSSVLSAILIFSLSSCGNSQPADESITVAAETTTSFSESVTTTVSETIFTAEVVETFTEATSQPYGESVSEQKVLMFMLYENEAWSFDRQVGILDSEGNYCYISHDEDGGEFLALENGNPLLDENWYQNLVDVLSYGNFTRQDSSGNEYENKLPDEQLELVKEYTEKFGEYKNYPMRSYNIMMCDAGIKSLYGVYLDENNVPQYIRLCAYGDQVYCIDNDDIADFVNSIEESFFYTDHFLFNEHFEY
ncbi:MAG: hypothetical protein K2N71_02280 [Oscillospiraceae bacterium]|nr:hypothetical protein [Oscillospiraceae bacterium]